MDEIEQARVDDAQDVAELYLHARRESLGAIPPVFGSDERVLKFYEQHGFVAIERTDGRHNEEQSPDVCYEWQPKGK